ncbi:MAG: glycoside hydrolase, partial [Candidatus Eisenbacteria bacterium]|nr:glycoside hydrolase [Candidatus Eisenbacteria bacterium]
MRHAGFPRTTLFVVLIFMSGGQSSATLGPWQTLGGISTGSTCLTFDEATNTLLVGSVTGFLYYDIDDSVWTNREEPGWIGREVWSILAHPAVQGRLLTGRENAFFKGYLELSPDWGLTHQVVWNSQGGGFKDLQSDPFQPDTMFACGWQDITPGDLLRSLDGGLTWQSLPNHVHYTMTEIAVDPQVPGRLYVGGDEQVTRSNDGGATWTQIASGLPPALGVYCVAVSPHDSLVLLCSNDNGIYRSSAEAVSWTLVDDHDCQHLAFNPGVPGMAAAVTFSPYRLLVSWDWGMTWIDRTDAPSALPAVDLVFHPAGDRLYVTTHDNGVFVRTVTPPITVQVEVVGAQVELSWTSDFGFSLYRVYRSSSAFDGFSLIATTSGMTFAEPVTADRPYYRVTGESLPSNSEEALAVDPWLSVLNRVCSPSNSGSLSLSIPMSTSTVGSRRPTVVGALWGKGKRGQAGSTCARG